MLIDGRGSKVDEEGTVCTLRNRRKTEEVRLASRESEQSLVLAR